MNRFVLFFCVAVAQTLCASETIFYKDWFKYSFGFAEEFVNPILRRNDRCYVAAFSSPLQLTRLEAQFPTYSISTSKNPCMDSPIKVYQAGGFEMRSLTELRTETYATKSAGCFNVLEGPENADVRKLQADPAYNGATFQVASNYNCLETVSPDQDILSQSLTSYIYDPTQGPAAAVGAPAGLLFRRYYLFDELKVGAFKNCWCWLRDECEKSNDHGQLPCQKYGSGERQVNLLSDVCNNDTGVEMSPAGYVKLANVQRLPNEQDCACVKIGCQYATQVVFGALNGHPAADATRVAVVPHKQIVNQVFVAASDFGQGTNKRSALADAWAKTILKASYEGTLRMAVRHGSDRVVLTWVGGGAFNNDPAWVVQILESLEPLIQELGLDVSLAVYGFTPGQVAYKTRLKALVNRTGGAWKA